VLPSPASLPELLPELDPPELPLLLASPPPELELVVTSPPESPPELLDVASVPVSPPESPPELELVVASPELEPLELLDPEEPLEPLLDPLLLEDPLLAPSSAASEPPSSFVFEPVLPPPPHPEMFAATPQLRTALAAIQPRNDPVDLMGTLPTSEWGRAHGARPQVKNRLQGTVRSA
jgi:hypothetical protein